MKLAIITPGGITNFGERAIMLGTAYALREQYPQATIAVFGYRDLPEADPHLFQQLQDLGVAFYQPIIPPGGRAGKVLRSAGLLLAPRLFLPRESYRFLRQAAVYAKGQESLTQDYGLVHFVDSVLEPLIVSRITKNITLFGHSIGPVYRFKAFAAFVVKRFRTIYVRDTRSQQALKTLGYPAEQTVLTKDLAYTAVKHFKAEPGTASAGHYLLIPNAAICTSPERSQQYLKTLRTVVDGLLAKQQTVLVGSSVTATDWNSDYRLCEQLKAEYKDHVVLRHYRQLHEFLADVQNARQVISSRLHPLIMATGLGTDVLALSRSPKVKGLLGDLGLSAAIIDPFNAPAAQPERS